MTAETYPEVVITQRPDLTTGHITVNGHPAPRPIPLAHLGRILSLLTDRAGSPIAVTLTTVDGTSHHDTIAPPAASARPDPELLSPGLFHPQETVHLVAILGTAVADDAGHPSAITTKRRVRRSAPRRLVGEQTGLVGDA